jgi:hypothetical protein
MMNTNIFNSLSPSRSAIFLLEASSPPSRKKPSFSWKHLHHHPEKNKMLSSDNEGTEKENTNALK